MIDGSRGDDLDVRGGEISRDGGGTGPARRGAGVCGASRDNGRPSASPNDESRDTCAFKGFPRGRARGLRDARRAEQGAEANTWALRPADDGMEDFTTSESAHARDTRVR